jgi:hypothetical protein
VGNSSPTPSHLTRGMGDSTHTSVLTGTSEVPPLRPEGSLVPPLLPIRKRHCQLTSPTAHELENLYQQGHGDILGAQKTILSFLLLHPNKVLQLLSLDLWEGKQTTSFNSPSGVWVGELPVFQHPQNDSSSSELTCSLTLPCWRK